ncbi:unnamed protein product [Rotaria sordida]|uniref:MAM domain-containing protein n=1 Tax=Rotaria sordida TaxID=392033 RepID=A0A814C4R0_9BILA|nr:unnamed protein product [Rotaria sordida]
MKVTIILLLIFINYSQLQEIITLFNCTFDSGFADGCIFQGILPPGDTLEIDIGQALSDNSIDPPNRPLSDATSVFSLTMNGEMCQFPYDLNGWDMYFCLYEESTKNYTCPTNSGNQTCIKGQYGYKTTSNPMGFLAIYKSLTAIIINSTDEKQCLRFYYYFTNSFREPSIVFRMAATFNTSNGQTIVIVQPNDTNRWYYSQTTFTLSSDEYYLMLGLSRASDLSDTTNFTFAIDNISITNGACSYVFNDSITTDGLIFNETSTMSIDLETDATNTNTTIEMIESSTTATIQETIITSQQSFTPTSMTSTAATNSIITSSFTTLGSSTIFGSSINTDNSTTIGSSPTSTQSITTTTAASSTISDSTSSTRTTFITASSSTNSSSTTSSTITSSTITSSTRTSTNTIPINATTKTTTISSTTTTSSNISTTKPKSKNLFLPLGLSLGLGIPLLVTIIIIAVYVVKFVLKL